MAFRSVRREVPDQTKAKTHSVLAFKATVSFGACGIVHCTVEFARRNTTAGRSTADWAAFVYRTTTSPNIVRTEEYDAAENSCSIAAAAVSRGFIGLLRIGPFESATVTAGSNYY